MPVHVRVCRDCGEEYRPGVVRCADCGGELEDRFEGEEEGAAPAAEGGKEPAAEADQAGTHVLAGSTNVRELVPMAERLRESGIEYWFVEQRGSAEGAPPRYALLVRETDASRALATVTELKAAQAHATEGHAVQAHFDEERGYVECPACGAKTTPGAAECPECGLGLGGDEGQVEEPRE
jgi:hypothetical protein